MINALMEDPVARVLMMRYEFCLSLLLLPLLVDSFTGKRKSILLWLRGVVGALVFLWGVYIAGATIWTSVRLAPEITGTAGPFLVFWILLALSTAAWFAYLGWPHAFPVLGGDESRLNAREKKVTAHRALFLRITLVLFFWWLLYLLLIPGSNIIVMYLSNYGLVVIGAYALFRGILEFIFRGHKGRRFPPVLSSTAGAFALLTGFFGLIYFAYKLVGGPGWILRPFDPLIWPVLLVLGLLLFRYIGGIRSAGIRRATIVQMALGLVAVGLFIWIRMDCQARVVGLEHWLADLVSDSRRSGSIGMDPEFTVDLVKPEARRLHNVIVPNEYENCLGIRNDTLWINWQSYPIGDNTKKYIYEVEKYVREIDEFYNKWPVDKLRYDLALCVDRDAPWHVLVRVVSVITRERDRKLAFVFQSQKPRRLTSPPASALTSAFRKIDRTRDHNTWKVAAYVKTFNERIIRPCGMLIKAFSSNSSYNWMKHPEHHADNYSKAISHCCCDIDLESFKAFVWHMGDMGDPIDLVVLDFAAPGDDKAKTIALPGDLPWSKAHEHVLLVAKENLPVRFQVNNR